MKDTIQPVALEIRGYEFDCDWASNPEKHGKEMFEEMMSCIEAMQDKHLYGPYWVYVDLLVGAKLHWDYQLTSGSGDTIKQRFLRMECIHKVEAQPSREHGKLLIVDAAEWGISEHVRLSADLTIK